jgi:hypothetical protein
MKGRNEGKGKEEEKKVDDNMKRKSWYELRKFFGKGRIKWLERFEIKREDMINIWRMNTIRWNIRNNEF